MWRSKKLLVSAVLTAVILAGSIGGVVLAQSGDEADKPPEARHAALLERTCEIYQENTGVAIEAEELQNAFAQAKKEMMAEARDARLQHLIEEGIITEDQAEQYKEWCQSRPDIPIKSGLCGRNAPDHLRGFFGPRNS